MITGRDLEFCADFESRVETLRVFNIIGNSLTEEGREQKRLLNEWIQSNADKYLTITGKH